MSDHKQVVTLRVHEVLMRSHSDGYATARAFKKAFGERAPDIVTLEKVYRQEDVEVASLAKIDACLRVPNRQFKTYLALKESLGINDQSISNAGSLLGSYRYHRCNQFGDLTSGGLVFFEYCGLYRFMNFIRKRNFDKFLETYREHKKDGNISPFSTARQSVEPDHQGYYFCQADRVYIVGADTSYMRVISGNFQTDLTRRYLRAIVLARDSGSIFAAKTILIHESNNRFEHSFSAGEFCAAMDAGSLPETFIRL